MNISNILKKFDELIAEAKANQLEWEGSKTNSINAVMFFRLLSSTRVLFAYLNADLHSLLLTEYLNSKLNPGIIQGILESAKREFEFGLLNHPRILATADSMESLLEQAEYLLKQEYKDAACVIIGGTLESTLKSMLTNKYPTISFESKNGLAHLNLYMQRKMPGRRAPSATGRRRIWYCWTSGCRIPMASACSRNG